MKDFEDFKETQLKENYHMSNEIHQKASLEDLNDLEARVIEKITQYFEKMSANFFLKEEINRKFTLLTKKLQGMAEGGGR